MKAAVLLFLLSMNVFGASALPKTDQFKIIKRAKNTFYLIKKRDEMNAQLKQDSERKLEILKINVVGNNPQILKVESVDVAPDFYCVVYKAGESGTSTIISEHRCALYNKKNLRFEGDIPFKYIPKGKTARNYPQPVYKNKDGLLKIYDNQMLLKTFSIP